MAGGQLYDARRFDRVMEDLIAGKPPRPEVPRPTLHQQRTVAIFAAMFENMECSLEEALRFADVVAALNPSWLMLARIWNERTRNAPWNRGFSYELEYYRMFEM